MKLASKKCVPCKGGEPPLSKTEANKLLKELSGWKIVDNRLKKEFTFRNFLVSLAFVNGIGQIAEEENHHPDFYLTFGRVEVILYTHKIKGLSESDFIMAAKTDQAFPRFDL